jgi:PhzF family phenazine biosynthesis protein
MAEVHLVHVFTAGPNGGNPAPIVIDAAAMSDGEMQQVARQHGHESGFVIPAPPESGYDYALRFWVPNHEMSMCGHATIGAVWLLNQLGRLHGDQLTLSTPSGTVYARVADGQAEITQPAGVVEDVDPAVVPEILDVLGITASDLAPHPIRNARTSRTKTLVPLADPSVLDALQPNFSRIEEVCDRAGSTGLYPYAPSNLDEQVFDARQFPRSSGYPEDAATGIAAAALAFGLLKDGLVEHSPTRVIRVRQGRAMGRPSEILLRFSDEYGLWLGGQVR